MPSECDFDSGDAIVRVCGAQITGSGRIQMRLSEKWRASSGTLLNAGLTSSVFLRSSLQDGIRNPGITCSKLRGRHLNTAIIRTRKFRSRSFDRPASRPLKAQKIPPWLSARMAASLVTTPRYISFHMRRKTSFLNLAPALEYFQSAPFPAVSLSVTISGSPSSFRAYAKLGVQAVFVPAAWPQNRIRFWELLIRARAAENQMYIIGINTFGTMPVDRYSADFDDRRSMWGRYSTCQRIRTTHFHGSLIHNS